MINDFRLVARLSLQIDLSQISLLNIYRCPPEVEFCHYRHFIWQNWMFSHGTLNLTTSFICFYVQKVKRCDQICFFHFRAEWKDTDCEGPEIDISKSRMWLKIMFWKGAFLNYSPVGNVPSFSRLKGKCRRKTGSGFTPGGYSGILVTGRCEWDQICTPKKCPIRLKLDTKKVQQPRM